MSTNLALDFNRPRHFLIIRRDSGTHVGFLCHDGDVKSWEPVMDWGDIVSTHPIRFHAEGDHSGTPEAVIARLQAAIGWASLEASQEHPDSCEKSDLFHAIEVLIGRAYEAGLAAAGKPAKRRGRGKQKSAARRKGRARASMRRGGPEE